MIRAIVQFVLVCAYAAAIGVGSGAVGGDCARGQTTVIVRPLVDRTDAEKVWPLMLGDVADITGPEAEKLRGVTVATEAAGLRKTKDGEGVLEIGTLRKAMESASVNWGRITLKSATSGCVVKFGKSVQREVTAVNEAPKPVKKQFERVEIVGTPGAMTVRGAIGTRLAAHYGVEPGALMLAFDGRDAEVLGTAVNGRRCEVNPGGSAISSRLPVRVEMYEGDRIVFSRSVDTEAQVLRRVVVATADLRRGTPLSGPNVRVEERWVSPALKVEVDLSGGAQALQRIEAGEVVVQERVESPLAVKRGDVVWVHCLSGNITVKAKARAMQAARDGEEIVLQLEGSKETFRARMNGPGRAVMLAAGNNETERDTAAGAVQ